jgi:hypothetical protein
MFAQKCSHLVLPGFLIETGECEVKGFFQFENRLFSHWELNHSLHRKACGFLLCYFFLVLVAVFKQGGQREE